jgi:hypothetical protein
VFSRAGKSSLDVAFGSALLSDLIGLERSYTELKRLGVALAFYEQAVCRALAVDSQAAKPSHTHR